MKWLPLCGALQEWNYDLAYSWAAGAEINDPWYLLRSILV
jgi:hypothetical protein